MPVQYDLVLRLEFMNMSNGRALVEARIAALRAQRAELLQRVRDFAALSRRDRSDARAPAGLVALVTAADEKLLEARIELATISACKEFAPSLVTECGVCADLEKSVESVKRAAQNACNARKSFVAAFDAAAAAVSQEYTACIDTSAAAEKQSTARLAAKAEQLTLAKNELHAILAGFSKWIDRTRAQQNHCVDEIVSLQTTLGHLCDSVIPGFEADVGMWLGRAHAVSEGAVRAAAELGGLKADCQLLGMHKEEQEARVSSLQTRTEELVLI